MGSADVIPGVSGGTIALVLGVYRALIDSIGLAAEAVPRALRGDLAGVLERLRTMRWELLLPLGAGILTAIVIAAQVVPGIIEDYPAQSRAFFFGMIGGSILIPWRRIAEHSSRTFAILVVGAIAGFLLTGLPERDAADPGLLRVFASAMIAICAMILPGVSGAFLLVVLGIYERTLEAVRERELAYIVTFGLGAMVGLGLFSALLKRLLSRAHDLTMAALVGLMAGSLRALWPYLEDDRTLRLPEEGDPLAAVIGLMVLGLAFVLVLAWLGERSEAGRARASLASSDD
jgi:putative membrane protein